MIRVKKVVGESFDLETGEGFSKGLLLSNDLGDTAVIEASEEDINAVLELMVSEKEKPKRVRKPQGSPTELQEAFSQAVTDTVHVRSEDLENGYYGPETYENGPASAEDDYDPGEVYGDASSGLPSI